METTSSISNKYKIISKSPTLLYTCIEELEKSSQIVNIFLLQKPEKIETPEDSMNNTKETYNKKEKDKEKDKKQVKPKKPDLQAEEREEQIRKQKEEEEKFNDLNMRISSLNSNYIFKFDKIEGKKGIYFKFTPFKYTLRDLLLYNKSGLDEYLIKTIVYQLLRAVKHIRKKDLIINNLKPETIYIDLYRHKKNLIGFENELEYLNSNINNINHNTYCRVKIGDLSTIKKKKTNQSKEENQSLANKQKQNQLKQEKPKQKEKEKKKNQNETVSHPLIDELLQTENYLFNKYSSPEMQLKVLFKNYFPQEDENENEKFSENHIDIWSIGCIFSEMIDGNQVFPDIITNEMLSISFLSKLIGLADYQKALFEQNGFSIDVDEKILPRIYIDKVNNSRIDLSLNIDNRFIGKASKKCISLLKRMLDANPLSRISPTEALNHSFLYPFFSIDCINGREENGALIEKRNEKLISSQIKKLTDEERKNYYLNHLIMEEEKYLSIKK